MSQYQATIDIFKNILLSAPSSFPAERLGAVNEKIAAIEADESMTRAETEKALIELGRELRPHLEAYKAFYKIYGEALEHERLRQNLSPAASEAYLKFLAEGNGVEDVRDAKKFDEFFDPELRAEIVEAELAAHDGVREEMNRMITGEKKEEFSAMLETEKEKLAKLETEIDSFAALAPRAEKWSTEILDKARVFRLGLAGIEALPELTDIKKETEYYVDIMGIE